MAKRMVLMRLMGETNPDNVIWQVTPEPKESLIYDFHNQWNSDNDSEVRLIQYGEFPLDVNEGYIFELLERQNEESFKDDIVNPLIGATLAMVSDPGTLPISFLKNVREELATNSEYLLNNFQPEVRAVIETFVAKPA